MLVCVVIKICSPSPHCRYGAERTISILLKFYTFSFLIHIILIGKQPPPPPITLTHHTPSHSHITHTHRGIIGSGLCVFSRYPIKSVFGHTFTINGTLPEIRHGEVFAGKGIILCRIATASGDIAFYNTHVRLWYTSTTHM